MKKVFAKEEYCIGCKLCEIWCLVEHSQSKNILKAFKKEIPRTLPRVIVEERNPNSFALQCRHCPVPDCVYSCISGAMYIDEKTGAVLHDPDKCVGCWTCILVCPYGAIQRNELTDKTASKCDLCGGKDIPSCVEHCRNGALFYEEVD